jgi:hypothetical protein
VLSGGLPCYAVYETADGRYMALAAIEEKFWRAFCEAIEHPDLMEQRLVTGKAAASVCAELQTVFKARPLAYWVDKLDEVDCRASPVLTLEEAMANEQPVARQMLVETERHLGAQMTRFALPVKLSDFAFSIDRPAPHRGEHTDELLEALGYTTERILELKRKRVVWRRLIHKALAPAMLGVHDLRQSLGFRRQGDTSKNRTSSRLNPCVNGMFCYNRPGEGIGRNKASLVKGYGGK